MNNNLSFWILAQLVTPAQMNTFSQDIYQRFTAITEPSGILNLQGNIAQTGTTITVPAGSFRFADLSATYLPFSSGVFGNTQSSTIITDVTGNGYIVARYSISPQIANQYNYTITVTCLFVASVISTMDVVLCTITTGVISSYAPLYYQPADVGDIKSNYNTVLAYPATNRIGTWLLCNGQTISAATYPRLALMLGKTGNFALPNLQGQTLAMANGTTHLLASSAGAETQIAVLAEHTHGLIAYNAHTHGLTAYNNHVHYDDHDHYDDHIHNLYTNDGTFAGGSGRNGVSDPSSGTQFNTDYKSQVAGQPNTTALKSSPETSGSPTTNGAEGVTPITDSAESVDSITDNAGTADAMQNVLQPTYYLNFYIFAM